MSVLSDRDIRAALDEGRVRIEPYDAQDLQPSSVDLHLDRAFRVAARIDSGIVWINTFLDVSPDVSFGAAKQSGIGTQLGPEGLEEFTQIKIITIAK